MDPLYYSILHVVGVILLTAYTFAAFANPDPKARGRTLMVTGVLSLIVLVAGFGLLSKLKLGFPSWVIVKLVAWLGISALSGMAFRRPGMTGLFRLIVIVLVVAAVWAVYMKPF